MTRLKIKVLVVVLALLATASLAGLANRIGVSIGTSKKILLPEMLNITPSVKLQLANSTKAVMKLSDAVPLQTAAVFVSSGNSLSLTNADFDEDGMPDLLSGDVQAEGGTLVFYRGNVKAIYPDDPTAKPALPFFAAEKFIALAIAPDFLATGDFNADGHFDVVVAARQKNALYFLLGDGKGNFAPAQTLSLPGTVNSLTTGEINRVDGLADLAVGVSTVEGAKVLLYANQAGAAHAPPREFNLPHEATSIVFGHLTQDGYSDMAIAAGSNLIVLEGSEEAPTLTRRSLSFQLTSLAIGRYTDSTRNQLAMLSADGSVYVTADARPTIATLRQTTRGRSNWEPRLLSTPATRTTGIASTTRQLLTGRFSPSANDDLLVLDQSSAQLQFLATNETTKLTTAVLEGADEVIAALPMRLNASAQTGLVVLRKNATTPFVITPEAAKTFTVNSVEDGGDTNQGNGICADAKGNCTLRAAIEEANQDADIDKIVFDTARDARTIILTSELPLITRAINLDATQPSGLNPIIISPRAATPCFSGLHFSTNSSGSHVRGLVVDGFDCTSGNSNQRNIAGLRFVNSDRNIIEGNTLKSNWRGLLLDQSGSNMIGGASGQTGNLITQSKVDGIRLFGLNGSNNTVQGNVIKENLDTGVEIGEVFDKGTTENDTNGNKIIQNFIQSNQRNGISISNHSRKNLISQNQIAKNYNLAAKKNWLGINLGGTGNAPLDNNNVYMGANAHQKFPVLTAALTANNRTIITGTMDGAQNKSYQLEFFSNAACDPSGYGEGEVYVGSISVTSGNFSIDLPPLPVGQWVTATATDTDGNTSEFSQCLRVNQGTNRPDLIVTMSAAPATIYAGNPLMLNFTVRNNGQFDATGVALSHTAFIPSGDYQIVSANTNAVGGTCSLNETGDCNLGTIKAGASVNVSLVLVATIETDVANPPQMVSLINLVTASSNEPDEMPQDNQVTNTIILKAAADLTIAQAVAPNLASAGSLVTYTINLTNQGPSVAANVLATFTLPSQLNGVTCNAVPGVSCGMQGNRGTVSVPNLPLGMTSVTVTGTLGCLVQDVTLIGTATITNSDTLEPNGATGNIATVNSTGQAGTVVATLSYDGGGSSLAFGPVVAGLGNLPPGTFTLRNTGCLSMRLDDARFIRTGNVANLSLLDDSYNYSVRLSFDDRSDITLPTSGVFDRMAQRIFPLNRSLQSGQQITGRVVFNPPWPFFAGRFSRSGIGIFASNVLPEVVNSQLVFNFTATENSSSGAVGERGTLPVTLIGRVSPAVQIIPRDGLSLPPPPVFDSAAQIEASPLVVLETIRNDFRVAVSLYDANLNVNQIVYQFYDTYGQVASQSIAIDLTDPIRQSGLLAGQPFTLLQYFTGAAGRPDITRVQVTVKDGDGTTVTASSVNAGDFASQGATVEQQLPSQTGIVISPPPLRLAARRDRQRLIR